MTDGPPNGEGPPPEGGIPYIQPELMVKMRFKPGDVVVTAGEPSPVQIHDAIRPACHALGVNISRRACSPLHHPSLSYAPGTGP